MTFPRFILGPLVGLFLFCFSLVSQAQSTFTLAGIPFSNSASVGAFDALVAKSPTALLSVETLGVAASVGGVAARWVGWGGLIATGVQVGKILLDMNGSAVTVLPAPGAPLPGYPGGATVPPSTSNAETGYFYGSTPYPTWTGACTAYCSAAYGVAVSGVSNPSFGCFCSKTGANSTIFSLSTQCVSGYTLVNNVCTLTNSAVALWDPVQVTQPVYTPNPAGTGFLHDPRDPNVAPTVAPPATGSGVANGLDRATGQPAQQSVTANPGGGVTYQTSVQTTTNNQTYTTTNNVTISSTGAVTNNNSYITNGTPTQAGTATPVGPQVPVTVDMSSTNAKLDKLDTDLTSPATDTALPPIPDLYARKYPQGLAGVWSAQTAALSHTGVVSLLSGLGAGVPTGGSCPSWSISLNLGANMNMGSGTIAPPCVIWPFLKAFFIICALLLARAMIFGG